MPDVSRRTFLQMAAAGTAAAAWPPLHAQGSPPWKVGGFTKELQDLSFEETARVAVEIGWDGIELALRAGGHVLPERVDEDLPKLVSALRARGQEWCPIGQGLVNPVFFKLLRSSGFRGPLTMQYEYPFDNDSVEARVRALKADNVQLRAWLKA